MRICTYNIWNHDQDYDRRMSMLANLIQTKNIDLLLLQEVRNIETVLKIKNACDFSHHIWKEYFDCKEGLAILSKYELNDVWTNWDHNEDVHNSGSMGATIHINYKRLSIVNLHLDYKYAHNREQELVKALNYHDRVNSDYKLIAGDFNTYPESKIYRFLTGLESLDGKSGRWIDLAEAYCVRKALAADITIDFVNNPRWKDGPCLEKPGRFDWIMLENPYPKDYPKLLAYECIGKEPIEGITPSDHCGVVVEIEV